MGTWTIEIHELPDGRLIRGRELSDADDRAYGDGPLVYEDADGALVVHMRGVRRDPERLGPDLEQALDASGLLPATTAWLVERILAIARVPRA